MKSLANPQDAADIVRRLRTVRPACRRHWGRMDAHQMVCHLRDTFLMGTDAKPVGQLGGPARQTVMRYLALYVPVRWPRGIPTRPELDQHAGGSRPSDFDADLDALIDVVERAVATPEFFCDRRHPALGPLSIREWLRWGYLHTDHHLRQFGC